MAKRYSGNEFALVTSVTQCSSSARTVIADSAIAARLAARKHGVSNAATLTAVISGVWRAGSIIATGNVRTGNVTRRFA